MEKVPLRVEPERPLDEGTEWVVGRSTETIDSSPSTVSQCTPGLLLLRLNQWASLYLELQRMSLYPFLISFYHSFYYLSSAYAPPPPARPDATPPPLLDI